jgi:hypothetical protein
MTSRRVTRRIPIRSVDNRVQIARLVQEASGH